MAVSLGVPVDAGHLQLIYLNFFIHEFAFE
jgi:hypothetical protein